LQFFIAAVTLFHIMFTFGKYSHCVTLIFSFDQQIFCADEMPCFCGRILRIGCLLHRSGNCRLLIIEGNFLLFAVGQVQRSAGAAQFFSTLLGWPEVKIYEGAPADVDADDALIAEAKE